MHPEQRAASRAIRRSAAIQAGRQCLRMEVWHQPLAIGAPPSPEPHSNCTLVRLLYQPDACACRSCGSCARDHRQSTPAWETCCTAAQRQLQQAAFRMCDAVVCNSRAAAQRLISDGLPEAKIRMIGNALAPGAFSQTEPLIPRRDGILRVGMVARMNAESKNHRIFLQAAAKLAARFPTIEFCSSATVRYAPSSKSKPSPWGSATVLFSG